MPVLGSPCAAHITFRPVAIAACMLVAAGNVTTLAQDHLGSSRSRMPLGGPPVAPPEDADRAHSERDELTAARLLLAARQDLAKDRPEVAQRVLEVLIARFPEAAVAADARRELFALYARTERIGEARQPPSPIAKWNRGGISASGAATALPQPQPRPPSVERSASAWRTTVVSHRRLQDDLRNGAGDRIFFSAGSADLGSRARTVLAAQAEWLMRRPDVEIVVEGHADDAIIGADDERLAEGRAGAVRDRLVAEGVPVERIRIEPKGARDRVATCGDGECAAQNRRVVLRVGLRKASDLGNSAAVPNASLPLAETRR